MAKRQAERRLTYAATIKQAMQAQGVSTQQLSDLSKNYGEGWGYEHFRKMLAGNPSISEDCNHVVCDILHLNEKQMWKLMVSEKVTRRFGTNLGGPDNARMLAVWPMLEPSEQERLLKAAEGYVAQRELRGKR